MTRKAKRFVRFRKSSFSSLIPHPSSLELRDRGFRRRLFLERGQNFLDQSVRGDAVFLSQQRDRAVFDKFIRPTNPRHRSVDLLRVEMLHDRATETIVQNV